jgi:hypothetical protein
VKDEIQWRYICANLGLVAGGVIMLAFQKASCKTKLRYFCPLNQETQVQKRMNLKNFVIFVLYFRNELEKLRYFCPLIQDFEVKKKRDLLHLLLQPIFLFIQLPLKPHFKWARKPSHHLILYI